MPDADVVAIFGLLRFAAPDPALIDQNRVLFERARDVGGKNPNGVLTPGQQIFERGDSP